MRITVLGVVLLLASCAGNRIRYEGPPGADALARANVEPEVVARSAPIARETPSSGRDLLAIGDARLERGEIATAREAWARAAELAPELAPAVEVRVRTAPDVAPLTAPPLRLRRAWSLIEDVDPEVVAASCDAVAVGVGRELRVHDGATGRTLFRRELAGRVTAVGLGEGLVAAADRDDVVVLDLGGRCVRRVDLASIEEGQRAQTHGPRALAIQDDALVILESPTPAGRAPLIAIDLSDGARRFVTFIDDWLDENGFAAFPKVRIDEASVSLLASPGAIFVSTRMAIACVDLASGDVRWLRRPLFWNRPVAATIVRTDESISRFDRPRPYPHRPEPVALALSGSVLTVISSRDYVETVDAKTGRRLSVRNVPWPAELEESSVPRRARMIVRGDEGLTAGKGCLWTWGPRGLEEARPLELSSVMWDERLVDLRSGVLVASSAGLEMFEAAE